MAYEHKEGRGSLLKNDRKTKPDQPDWKGDAKWKGELVSVALWEGTTQGGIPRMSLQIEKKWEPSAAQPVAAAPVAPIFDDDINF